MVRLAVRSVNSGSQILRTTRALLPLEGSGSNFQAALASLALLGLAGLYMTFPQSTPEISFQQIKNDLLPEDKVRLAV